MKTVLYIGLLIFMLVCGCAQKPVSTAPGQGVEQERNFSTARPKAGDIIGFEADPIPARAHFKDFKVERDDIEEVLRRWHQVSQEHWQHGYSHVALGDRTGTIRLKSGRVIRWMVRPGGLAELIFQDGTRMYLARELTAWEKDTEPTVGRNGCVESDKGELELVCSMERTKFAIGEKLPPPKVTIYNNTRADVNLIGPTLTVIACTLVQPDKSIIPMYISMPTGLDPRRMPPRKLEEGKVIELTATGIWYYEQASGYRAYVFQKEGDYEFRCEYEGLNCSTIKITVRKNAEEAADESERMEAAYEFLIKKVQGDKVNLIAAKDDKNSDLIRKVIHTNRLKLEVENISNVEKRADLCYYSKCTNEVVAIVDVMKRDEKSYYVSYYTGPEGGASKEIIIEKRDGKWVVTNDDGRWSIK